MHRISGENMNPGIDTEAKLASIKPLYFNRDSKILDTCMGLGYTCIGAAQKLQAGKIFSMVCCCTNMTQQYLYQYEYACRGLSGLICDR